MGLFYFLGLVVLVVLAIAAAIWVIDYLSPDHPTIIDRGLWVLGVVILAMILARAMGLFTHDITIPHV
jgi:hypothetical protein